ncbi:sporulation integral membrane protein YtvI [Gorillibacterium timonense]|uniref:sporulation integral membrane protein YtvI n=1 Tax=Gorillibacterium timonense TaxID=1689269 RepID=UPI00071CFA7A|nr:sporulation integral membrane protein YtvI [Gorillibacterium timonense]
MMSFYRKYYKTVFDIALIALTVYLFMLLFSFLYKIATPIFLSLVIFAIIEPLAKRLHKLGMKKSLASAISTLLFVLILLGILFGLGAVITLQFHNISTKVTLYASQVQSLVEGQSSTWQHQLEDIVPPDVLAKIQEYSGTALARLSDWTTSFFTVLIAWLTSFSSFMVNFVVAIILAYFLSIEIDVWKRLAGEKTPKTFKTAFTFLRVNVLAGIAGYLKAQLKLITVTFVVIFIALLLLRVDNALSISLLAAVFDLLPLLGVSTVFIPWIVYLFLVGQTSLAIWLTVLLAVVLLVRQILEPKITGDTLGVSAFTMLAFMIVSLSLFGVAGLILSPVLIITLKALYEQGYLQRWIRLPEDEYESPPWTR